MALHLYFHPFSSYCQKALVALYENARAVRVPHLLEGPDSPASRELATLWPMKRFPVLVDGGRTVIEATCIIEYLGLHQPGPGAADSRRSEGRARDADDGPLLRQLRLDAAAESRVRSPAPPEGGRDPYGVQKRARCSRRVRMARPGRWPTREWAAGDRFSLADCAAAPFLFYADWTHPIGTAHPNVTAYRQRLLQRPSFARAVDEARPYRDVLSARCAGPRLNRPVGGVGAVRVRAASSPAASGCRSPPCDCRWSRTVAAWLRASAASLASASAGGCRDPCLRSWAFLG